jgi:glycosyltransferase involved in cell wall biosynthesis
MSNYNILISVIIPSYNAESTLAKTLTSLECQSLAKELFEVIVIDDWSTDSTKHIVDLFIQKWTFNIYYIFQKNQWVWSARNCGIALSHWTILAFTDADCVCDIDWLSTIYQHIVIQHKQFIWWCVYSNDTIIFPRKMAPVNQIGITANLALDYQSIWYIKPLFNTWFHGMLGDDIDLVIRLADQGISLSYIPEMKVLHPANILSFDRFLMRWRGRMNEVWLYKRHGSKVLNCFSTIYKPLILNRISFFTLIVLCSIFLFAMIGIWFWILYLILTISILILLFLSFWYNFFVIYRPIDAPSITLYEKIKTLCYFICTIPLFFRFRIKWILLFRFFML